ncbi:MAG: hypothetical protein JSV69_13140 [Chloroflexota bacterium]|nr:MAG: hypothetical protein JSV69_13140 [Chloroflexota bacterium]
MEFQKLFRYFFNPWLVFGAIGIGVALLIATLLLLSWTRMPGATGIEGTAVITVIDLSTATPILPTVTPTEVETPPSTGLPLPPPGDISKDAYVQVIGTGGNGLRLRVGPGLDRDVRLLGVEDEVFLVQDGPIQADSYTWWFLVGPFDEARQGWAVANFLRVVQNP